MNEGRFSLSLPTSSSLLSREKSGEEDELLHGTEVHRNLARFSALHGEADVPISAQFLTLHHGRQDQFSLKEN